RHWNKVSRIVTEHSSHKEEAREIILKTKISYGKICELDGYATGYGAPSRVFIASMSFEVAIGDNDTWNK
ncbi:8152_t:CDS:1, partial [Ambispora leptoticha]